MSAAVHHWPALAIRSGRPLSRCSVHLDNVSRDAQRAFTLQPSARDFDGVHRDRHRVRIVAKLQHRGPQIREDARFGVEKVGFTSGGSSSPLGICCYLLFLIRVCLGSFTIMATK